MIRTAAIAALATLALAAAPALGQTAGDFTDWTSLSANIASGTLHGQSVSLSGSHVWNPPVSELGGQSTAVTAQ